MIDDGERTEPLHMDKFVVRRSDGSSRKGKKHHDCEYFVLDINHDPFATAALKAYAVACSVAYPQLAKGLETLIAKNIRLTRERYGALAAQGLIP